MKTLNKHAPLKTKAIRGNHKSFINKNLRKEIMKRSALKKRTIASNNPEMIKLYKKQRNYVVNLSRKVAIPIKIVKLANKKNCKDLANCINECIKQNKFPNELKIADITPIFKKEDPLDKNQL